MHPIVPQSGGGGHVNPSTTAVTPTLGPHTTTRQPSAGSLGNGNNSAAARKKTPWWACCASGADSDANGNAPRQRGNSYANDDVELSRVRDGVSSSSSSSSSSSPPLIALFGISDSGKSTLFKHAMMLYSNRSSSSTGASSSTATSVAATNITTTSSDHLSHHQQQHNPYHPSSSAPTTTSNTLEVRRPSGSPDKKSSPDGITTATTTTPPLPPTSSPSLTRPPSKSISNMSPTSFAPTFPLAHRRLYRSIVVHNILHDILALADRSAHFSPIQDPGILPLIDNLRRFAAHDPQTLTPAIAEQIVALWNDKNIQITFQRRAAFHMHDTAAYLVPHSLYIAEQGDEYVPSDLDVLVCHFRTTGIVDAQFQVGEQALRIVDVGGQRNERAKWPLLFEQTSAIIYVFGISEIDRLQREDDLTPRLHEALNLFSDLVQTPSLRHVPIILCFTKPEQLELNLQMRMNMTSYLESYNGDPFSAAPILEFVCFQFLERAHNSRDRLYVHTCSPFDAKHVHVLFDSLPSILRSHKRTKSSHA